MLSKLGSIIYTRSIKLPWGWNTRCIENLVPFILAQLAIVVLVSPVKISTDLKIVPVRNTNYFEGDISFNSLLIQRTNENFDAWSRNVIATEAQFCSYKQHFSKFFSLSRNLGKKSVNLGERKKCSRHYHKLWRHIWLSLHPSPSSPQKSEGI